MPYTGERLLKTDIAQQEIKLLKSGLSYKGVSKITGTKIGTLKERNRLVYNVDIYSAFRKRIDRNGIPQNLSVSDNFGHYFVGFFDGEGTFVVWHRRRDRGEKSYPEFRLSIQIVVRKDDVNVLEYIMDNIGGNIYETLHKNSPTNPAVTWRKENIKELAENIIPVFDKYPLHTKKRREYDIWKPLVRQRYISTLGGGTQRGGPVSDTFEEGFIKAVSRIKSIREFSDS